MGGILRSLGFSETAFSVLATAVLLFPRLGADPASAGSLNSGLEDSATAFFDLVLLRVATFIEF